MLYRNKEIVLEESLGNGFTKVTFKREEESEETESQVVSDLKLPYLKSETPINFSEALNPWKKAIFDEIMLIYQRHGVTLGDIPGINSFLTTVAEEMRQRLVAVKIAGVEDKDFIPGVNYEEKINIHHLIEWNRELDSNS